MKTLIQENRKQEFPLAQARELIRDLYQPNPWIYWADFLLSSALGWASFIATLKAPLFSLQQGLFFFIAVFSIYRAALFIHEIAHFKKGSFLIFQNVWNLICGFPLMVPSFLYQSVHFDHHKQNFYGTVKDGEYFPFASKGRALIILHIGFSFCIPLIFLFRFTVLVPLSYFSRGLREFLIQKMSSLNIDLNYQRPSSSLVRMEGWKIQEVLTSFYGISFIALILLKIMPAKVLFMWYCLGASVFAVNSVRTLVAHHYENTEEGEMSFTDQMLDSINNPGNRWVTPLWAPVGLRFHATHHLFPDLPYHALGEAHYRILKNQGKHSLYGQTVQRGLLPSLAQLWKRAGKSNLIAN